MRGVLYCIWTYYGTQKEKEPSNDIHTEPSLSCPFVMRNVDAFIGEFMGSVGSAGVGRRREAKGGGIE